MAMSINTNTGAMMALQNLSKTNCALGITQLRVTTGLRINGPKDDAATFAIAQNMRGDIAGMSAVKTNLSLGQSVVNVAIDAGKAIEDLLIEMKAKSVQASQAGLNTDSYTALNQEFTSLRAQIEAIAASAEFNGTNLINSAASNLDVLSTVDGSTITITKQSIDATTLTIHTAALTDSTVAGTALTAVSQAIGLARQAGGYSDGIYQQAPRHSEARRRQSGGCGFGEGKRQSAGLPDQPAIGRSSTGDRQCRPPEHFEPARRPAADSVVSREAQAQKKPRNKCAALIFQRSI